MAKKKRKTIKIEVPVPEVPDISKVKKVPGKLKVPEVVKKVPEKIDVEKIKAYLRTNHKVVIPSLIIVVAVIVLASILLLYPLGEKPEEKRANYAAFMASITNKRFTATQYALLTSLMGVPRVIASAPTGFLAKNLGWGNFFVACALIAIPGLLILIKYSTWNVTSVKSAI